MGGLDQTEQDFLMVHIKVMISPQKTLMRPGRAETHQRRKKDLQKRKNKPKSVYNIKRGFNNMAVLKFNPNNDDKPEAVAISEPIIPDEPKAKAEPKKTAKKSSKKKASSK
mgnify:CR=1 FL=1